MIPLIKITYHTRKYLTFSFASIFSPQLQPVECAWPLLHEPIANRSFDNMNHLEDTIITRSNYLMSNPEILKGAVG
ncbi:MAG: hypothetical protein PHF26_04170, partial [Candidatus Gracilibacteria bacterium]|nr:hypothetical protein [Candidatus Gracilibacteria bacterium]